MKLSIITINRNNAVGLRRTIESVVSQTYNDFEYIIIDGASTDGSVEVIKEYSDKITYWVSEPDTGIYNAMNKGILKAKGEYLLFLNSGDWLVDEQVVSDFCNCNINQDIVCGNIYLIENGEIILAKSPEKEALDFNFFYHGSLLHPASFIRKELFIKYGFYDEQYKIIADWEFFLRVILINKVSYKHYERIISNFPVDGISSFSEHEEQIINDRKEVILNYVPEAFYLSYEKNVKELTVLRKVNEEYSNLKNGKFKILVNFLLFIKTLKK